MAQPQKKYSISTPTKIILLVGGLTTALTFSGIARILAEAVGITSYRSWGGLIQWPGLVAMFIGSFMARQERKDQDARRQGQHGSGD
jgi:formate hydrogenlyase subunit 3/multisubunit Na+/H+ antiporter MnhD subunit